jgi:hypothetical protein
MDRKVIVAMMLTIVLMFASYTFIIPASSNTNTMRSPDIQQKIFIHYAKPDNPGKGKPSGNSEGYYKLIGAKWKSFPVHLEVNPSNLDQTFVLKAIGMAAEEWDSGAYSQSEGIAWYGVAPNLFADEIALTNKGYDDLAWTSDKMDGSNTIVWGNYSTPGVIAVTILWYNRATKTILEFDIVFDTDYQWGNATENSKVMDLQNIATHELGHGVGLDDIYQDPAYQETMYGYSTSGEVIKRDLYKGDKAGITKLYGAASS